MDDGVAVKATMLGAFEGSISVLLTILAGYVATRAGLMDKNTTKKVSKLCTTLFLPCLLVEQMGPQLTPAHLKEMWIMPVWGITSTLIAHGLGWFGSWLFNLPKWTIVAAGRANSSALPLLLLDALENAGVLDVLKGSSSDSSSETLQRARTLILLNAIVQQCFTFVFGPGILAKPDDGKKDRLLPGPGPGATTQDSEHVGLLVDHDGMDGDNNEDEPHHVISQPVKKLDDVPDIHWPRHLKFAERPVKVVGNFWNPVLTGATLAFIFGMVAPLRHAFLTEDGIFYTPITNSISNLGGLFVALQMFTVGGELAIVPSANPGVKPTVFTLFIRFVAMPAISVGFVLATANLGIYPNEGLILFLLVLLPSGPSAMVLANLAEMVDNEQGPISGYLTVAYLLSPLIAIIATVALLVVEKVKPS